MCVCTPCSSFLLQLAGGDTHHLPLDLSRIYPTPPSVESADDKDEEGKLGGGGVGMEDKGDFRMIVESTLIVVSVIMIYMYMYVFHPIILIQ